MIKLLLILLLGQIYAEEQDETKSDLRMKYSLTDDLAENYNKDKKATEFPARSVSTLNVQYHERGNPDLSAQYYDVQLPRGRSVKPVQPYVNNLIRNDLEQKITETFSDLTLNDVSSYIRTSEITRLRSMNSRRSKGSVNQYSVYFPY